MHIALCLKNRKTANSVNITELTVFVFYVSIPCSSWMVSIELNVSEPSEQDNTACPPSVFSAVKVFHLLTESAS